MIDEQRRHRTCGQGPRGRSPPEQGQPGAGDHPEGQPDPLRLRLGQARQVGQQSGEKSGERQHGHRAVGRPRTAAPGERADRPGQPDRQQRRAADQPGGEIGVDEVGEGPLGGDPLVVADPELGQPGQPVEPVRRMRGRDGDRSGNRDEPRNDRTPHTLSADGQDDGNEADDAEEHQTVGQEHRRAEQQSAGQAGEQPTAAGPETDQSQPTDGHTREQAVGRHRHPHRAGEQGDEGHDPPGRRLGAQFAQRDREGDADRRGDQDAQGAGPEPAAQADPVEHPEHQRGQRRMTCDMGGPHGGAVDAFTEGDVVGEGRQEGGRVADPGQVMEVFVRVLQHVDPALAQPVDEGQRTHPGQVQQPARQQESAPGQDRHRPLQLQPHEHTADGQRRTPTQMRGPVGEQGWTRQHDGEPAALEAEADQCRDGDQGQCGGESDRVAPPPARSRLIGEPVLLSAHLWRSSTTIWSPIAR